MVPSVCLLLGWIFVFSLPAGVEIRCSQCPFVSLATLPRPLSFVLPVLTETNSFAKEPWLAWMRFVVSLSMGFVSSNFFGDLMPFGKTECSVCVLRKVLDLERNNILSACSEGQSLWWVFGIFTKLMKYYRFANVTTTVEKKRRPLCFVFLDRFFSYKMRTYIIHVVAINGNERESQIHSRLGAFWFG